MSAEFEDDFFAIVSGNFTADETEAMSLDARINPYTTEPINPGRKLLLETFHMLLEGLALDNINKDWDKIHGQMPFTKRKLAK